MKKQPLLRLLCKLSGISFIFRDVIVAASWYTSSIKTVSRCFIYGRILFGFSRIRNSNDYFRSAGMIFRMILISVRTSFRYRIVHINGLSTPLQIVAMIVWWVSVYMINHSIIVRIVYKMLCYKPMNKYFYWIISGCQSYQFIIIAVFIGCRTISQF